jgi:hypothetical protein
LVLFIKLDNMFPNERHYFHIISQELIAFDWYFLSCNILFNVYFLSELFHFI